MFFRRPLVFDIGFHRGEDTGYYLHRGYDVIAVDADPEMIAAGDKSFRQEIAAGRLTLLQFAICERDDDFIELNISTETLWTSVHLKLANKGNRLKKTITVPTCRLDTLLNKYRRPYYCKIDIEGVDATAIESLANAKKLPKYMSAESECVGQFEVISEEESLRTLNSLRAVGYRRFKLVEQNTLRVFDKRRFFGTPAPVEPSSSEAKFQSRHKGGTGTDYRAFLKYKHGYEFPFSATGPFGPQLEGRWREYDEARELLLFHRRTFFEQPGVEKFSFWCDWHATVS